MNVILKPQDVLVTLKLVAISDRRWSYNELALEIGMSPSEVHSAVRRALRAGLLYKRPLKPGRRRSLKTSAPSRQAVVEFLTHGIRYVFVPELGGETRGMPTAYAAAPLKEHIVADNPLPPVWPTSGGQTRGLAFSPLYSSAPLAAAKDPALYELLALVDAIRGGRARERKLAADELRKRIRSK